MFVNTKMDFGPCERYHSEDLKEDFEKNGDVNMFDTVVERDFMSRINDIDRSIKVSMVFNQISAGKIYCTRTDSEG